MLNKTVHEEQEISPLKMRKKWGEKKQQLNLKKLSEEPTVANF
jgi:hypothetical protein